MCPRIPKLEFFAPVFPRPQFNSAQFCINLRTFLPLVPAYFYQVAFQYR